MKNNDVGQIGTLDALTRSLFIVLYQLSY